MTPNDPYGRQVGIKYSRFTMIKEVNPKQPINQIFGKDLFRLQFLITVSQHNTRQSIFPIDVKVGCLVHLIDIRQTSRLPIWMFLGCHFNWF